MCDDPIGVGSQVVLLLLYLRVVFAPFFIYRNQYETGKTPPNWDKQQIEFQSCVYGKGTIYAK